MADEIPERLLEFGIFYSRLLSDMRKTHNRLQEIAFVEEAAKHAEVGLQRQAYRAHIRAVMNTAAQEIADLRSRIENFPEEGVVEYYIVGLGSTPDKAKRSVAFGVKAQQRQFKELDRTYEELLEELPRGIMNTPDADGKYNALVNYQAYIAKLDIGNRLDREYFDSVLEILSRDNPEPEDLSTKQWMLKNFKERIDEHSMRVLRAKTILEDEMEEQIAEIKRAEGYSFDNAQEIASDTLYWQWTIWDTRVRNVASLKKRFEAIAKEVQEESEKEGLVAAASEANGE